jgi:hypothetical protein
MYLLVDSIKVCQEMRYLKPLLNVFTVSTLFFPLANFFNLNETRS